MVYLVVGCYGFRPRLDFPSVDHVNPGTEDGLERLPWGWMVLTSGPLIIGDITLDDSLERLLVITIIISFVHRINRHLYTVDALQPIRMTSKPNVHRIQCEKSQLLAFFSHIRRVIFPKLLR
jgi:hypothetical protein